MSLYNRFSLNKYNYFYRPNSLIQYIILNSLNLYFFFCNNKYCLRPNTRKSHSFYVTLLLWSTSRMNSTFSVTFYAYTSQFYAFVVGNLETVHNGSLQKVMMTVQQPRTDPYFPCPPNLCSDI